VPSVRAADQRSAEPVHESAIGLAGGPAVREPDRLTPEWAFGPSTESLVGRLVQPADQDRPGAVPSEPEHEPGHRRRALVIGCGALARELVEVTRRVPGLDVACLAPDLHNRPDGIPAAVQSRIRRARADGYERIFVAYADCGTGGLLEPVLAAEGVERLPGAHCYEVFAGGPAFAALADDEPGTFWLTDFLARNFERLVIRGLGIDRHPELQPVYFAHYTRVVYLSQTDDHELRATARRAAERLGLAFEHRPTGIANLAAPIEAWAARTTGPAAALTRPDSRGTEGSDAVRSHSAADGLVPARISRRAKRIGTNRADPVGPSRGARIQTGSDGRP
jgi:hypothetical protein